MQQISPNTKKLLIGAAAIGLLILLVANSSSAPEKKNYLEGKDAKKYLPPEAKQKGDGYSVPSLPPTTTPTGTGKYYAERSVPDWKNSLLPIIILQHEGNPPYRYSLPKQQLHAAQWEKPINIGGYHIEFQGMMQKLPTDTIMLDVGANVGLSGLPVAAMGHTVIAFEPVPANWRKMQESIEANGFHSLLHLYPVAVGAERKTQTFYVPQGNEDNTASTKDGALTNVQNPVDEIEVKIETIDKFLEEHTEYDASRIRFMKIDTQGFEEFVLKGARKLLEKQRDVLVIQAELAMNIVRRVGLKPISVLEFMDEMGYEVYVGKTRLLPPTEFFSFTSSTDSSFEVYYCKKGRHFNF